MRRRRRRIGGRGRRGRLGGEEVDVVEIDGGARARDDHLRHVAPVHQPREVGERDVERVPGPRGDGRHGTLIEGDLVLAVVAPAEGAVAPEVHQLDAEGGGIVRPQIDVEARHGRRVDGLRGELDPGVGEVRVLLDRVAGDLDVLHVGLVPHRRPGVHRNVVVGVAEEGDHIRSGPGRDRRRTGGRSGDVHGHGARRGGGAEGRGDRGRAGRDERNRAVRRYGCHAGVGRGEGEVGRGREHGLVLAVHVEGDLRAADRERAAHLAVDGLRGDFGPRVDDRPQALELHIVEEDVVADRILGALGDEEEAALLAEPGGKGQGKRVLGPARGQRDALDGGRIGGVARVVVADPDGVHGGRGAGLGPEGKGVESCQIAGTLGIENASRIAAGGIRGRGDRELQCGGPAVDLVVLDVQRVDLGPAEGRELNAGSEAVVEDNRFGREGSRFQDGDIALAARGAEEEHERYRSPDPVASHVAGRRGCDGQPL